MSIRTAATLLSNLKRLLDQDLPGVDAHVLMAPPARIESLRSNMPALENVRKAAVLIPLYFNKGELYTVFIKRQVYDGVHSGQIAFPGGKMEYFDESFTAAAIREAEEEIGINHHHVYILGSLSQLYIPPSNFLIEPVAGYIFKRPDFVIQESEVQDIIEVPVSHFYSKIKKEYVEIKTGRAKPFKAPCYLIGGNAIWGATAMVISEFLSITKNLNITESCQLLGHTTFYSS